MFLSDGFNHTLDALLINIFDEQSDLKISHAQVRILVAAILAMKEENWDEVNIQFVSSETISELHQEFFNDPSPTDCISFPLDDKDSPVVCQRILGDIFVCPETALKYSAKHDSDPLEETTLYIVHGLLHLLGFDDLQPADRKAMRAEERRVMRVLKEQKLVLTSD